MDRQTHRSPHYPDQEKTQVPMLFSTSPTGDRKSWGSLHEPVLHQKTRDILADVDCHEKTGIRWEE